MDEDPDRTDDELDDPLPLSTLLLVGGLVGFGVGLYGWVIWTAATAFHRP